MELTFPLLLLPLLLFLSLNATTATTTIGVTYSPTATSPTPDRVCSSLQSLHISAVRLPNPAAAAVRSFAYTNTSLLLSLPNSLIPSLASNRSSADTWLYTYVVPFYPRAKIAAVSVGTDVLNAASDLSGLLLPAMRNVHRSLERLGIRHVSVSSTFSFVDVVTSVFPPSSAEFQNPVGEVLMKPLLEFLSETNSSFFVNLYPYHVYKLRPDIPIGLALFQEEPFTFRDDVVTGVRYRNLFDMMVDSVITAMTVAGHENIPVVVTETGWPSSSSSSDPDADEVYAELYTKGLIRHLRSGFGTPLRKEGVAEAYVYELFDSDDEKKGTERWGLFYPNMTERFRVDFSAANDEKPELFFLVFGIFLLLALSV